MTFRIREKLPVRDEETFRSDRKLVKALALLMMITGLSALMFYLWFFYVEFPTFSEDVQEIVQSFAIGAWRPCAGRSGTRRRSAAPCP